MIHVCAVAARVAVNEQDEENVYHSSELTRRRKRYLAIAG
jgi:hypothetical protein